MELWIIWTVVRLLVPFLMTRWVLLGLAISMLADLSDYHTLPINDENYIEYQMWDKVMDTYYLAIAWYTSWSWKDKLARRLSTFSFMYRTIGMGILMITGNQSFLIFFPNFFESFFLFYVLYNTLTERAILMSSSWRNTFIVCSILISKVIQEYFMHVLKTTPDRLLHIGNSFMYYSSEVIQVVTYFSFPLIVLTWMVLRKRNFHIKFNF